MEHPMGALGLRPVGWGWSLRGVNNTFLESSIAMWEEGMKA